MSCSHWSQCLGKSAWVALALLWFVLWARLAACLPVSKSPLTSRTGLFWVFIIEGFCKLPQFEGVFVHMMMIHMGLYFCHASWFAKFHFGELGFYFVAGFFSMPSLFAQRVITELLQIIIPSSNVILASSPWYGSFGCFQYSICEGVN